MVELLWHGRGGQGAFTAAKMLGTAYTLHSKNKYALAFPSFGPERRGAPMRAFTKLSNQPIGDRSQIKKADFIIFLDETLFTIDALQDLKEGGKILINSKRNFEDSRILSIDGDSLANQILKMPIVNTAMLGAIQGLLEDLDIEDINQAIRICMSPKLQEKNIQLAKSASELLARGANV